MPVESTNKYVDFFEQNHKTIFESVLPFINNEKTTYYVIYFYSHYHHDNFIVHLILPIELKDVDTQKMLVQCLLYCTR